VAILADEKESTAFSSLKETKIIKELSQCLSSLKPLIGN
jgi:hypothetical protein